MSPEISVFYQDGEDMTGFALFPREGAHKPAFVWKLAAVWHEKGTSERFLLSPRDDTAIRVRLVDVCAGAA
jgi:hypothetical protein